MREFRRWRESNPHPQAFAANALPLNYIELIYSIVIYPSFIIYIIHICYGVQRLQDHEEEKLANFFVKKSANNLFHTITLSYSSSPSLPKFFL